MTSEPTQGDMNRTEEQKSVTVTVEAVTDATVPASTTTEDGASQVSVIAAGSPDDYAAEESPQADSMAERTASEPNTVQASSKEQAAKDEEKKARNEITVNALPSYAEIYNAVPAAGIHIKTLTAQFQDQLDETNIHLFITILKTLTTCEDGLFKRVAVMPSKERLDDIVERAKKPALAVRNEVKDISCQFESTSIFEGPLTVTFDESAELVRAHSKMLPEYLYRVFYETSATASCYVEQGQWPQNREVPHFKFREENAFQSLRDFNPLRDLRKERIRRHTIWNKKKDPSSYISVFNSKGSAERRARFHYEESGRIGKRVSVAKISTNGLIPATIHGTVSEAETFWTNNPITGDMEPKTRTVKNPINIPVWVRGATIPSDGSDTAVKDLWKAGCEMWLSITELRRADVGLKLACSRGHDYEWLSCGQIPKSAVVRVLPFDGDKIHEVSPDDPVRIFNSVGSWTFDWGMSMWQPDGKTDAQNLAIATRGQKKRKVSDSNNVSRERTSKRRKTDRHCVDNDETDDSGYDSVDSSISSPTTMGHEEPQITSPMHSPTDTDADTESKSNTEVYAKLFETLKAFLDTVQEATPQDLDGLKDKAVELTEKLQVHCSGDIE